MEISRRARRGCVGMRFREVKMTAWVAPNMAVDVLLRKGLVFQSEASFWSG